MSLLTKYDQWVDAIRDLLERHHTYFPRATIGQLIAETIDAEAVAWNWSRDGSFGCEFNRSHFRNNWSLLNVPAGTARQMQERHPLLQWFQATGDPKPMTVGRLPRTAIPAEDFALLYDALRPGEVEQQMVIPYQLSVRGHRAYALARGQEDFSADDVELARRIQPLLDLLQRQVVATQVKPSTCTTETGLTGREVAVLALLSGGGTAEAIARRLGISPRTVTNHLQHIYRKLGVSDRMRAVLVAQTLGLINPACGPEAAHHGARKTRRNRPALLPDEVTDGTGLTPEGHRWMLLLQDADASPWEPPPDERAIWYQSGHSSAAVDCASSRLVPVIWTRTTA
jgi:DNA-binding CsgD family transcriptional regulator